MKTAILTKRGAKALGLPHLAGEVVQYDRLTINGNADNVYYKGKNIGGWISVRGAGKGLKIKKG
jgi:hypothetical protein